jgi:hypothetical protein
MGILLQDADFLCENPLNDKASAFKGMYTIMRPVQTSVPLTLGGDEYTRSFGTPGELITLADGAINTYVAGTKFRLFRGGGSAFVLSGDNPGGPIDWFNDSLNASLKPVLKGGVLACRAMLVRNFYEVAPTGAPAKKSDGDEIQMVVLTYGVLGGGNTKVAGVPMNGVISPTGYGEGYAAADRYRCMGRPLYRGYNQDIPDSNAVTLATYPEDER